MCHPLPACLPVPCLPSSSCLQNTNMGNHMRCLKYILPVAEGQGSTFVPSVFPGSSRPLKMSNNKFFQPYR